MVGMNWTDQEILDRIRDTRQIDMFGVMLQDMVCFLSFDSAKMFLKEDVTHEQWVDDCAPMKSPLDRLREYLPFAWEKANGCRGLSAIRSLHHLRTWLWLAGLNELADSFDIYEFYGKESLVISSFICGFDWKAHDDGIWRNGEDTAPIDEATRSDLIRCAEKTAESQVHLLNT